jgi:segregation and condensation protein B
MSEDRRYMTAMVIYSVLFASGEPVPVKSFTRGLHIPEKDFEEGLEELKGILERTSPLLLREIEGKLLLQTQPEYGDYIQAALAPQKRTRLSDSALETLAIIAYNQPISRARIEEMRGKDSSSTLNTLLGFKLIRALGDIFKPSTPVLYQTTEAFLVAYGLSKLSDLPDIQEFINAPE